jgi:hypothetical protein
MRHVSLSALLIPLLALALSGCAGNSGLILRYSPLGQDTGACAAPVGVGEIKDNTNMKAIGDRDGQTKYYPMGSAVSDWVHDAVESELKARGCQVLKAAAGDSPFAADYAISGEGFKVYMTQEGYLKSTLAMKVKFTLEKYGKMVFEKTYEGSWERTSVALSQERAEKLFTEALGDLLRDAIPELMARMK